MSPRDQRRLVLNDAGQFVLRAPLLPFDVLRDVVDGAGTDYDALVERLRDVVRHPIVREAIFLASPSLEERLDRWLAGTDPEARATTRAVLSYVTRMASRPTPFGLFAGCHVGTVGEATELAVPDAPDVRRTTRLDFGFLAGLVADLEQDAEVQAHLPFFPNSSLYRAGGRLRMAEARYEQSVRYRRVTFEEDDALAATLDRARGGARLADLAAKLVDDEVTIDEATEYVEELVGAQLLVSGLGPPITGDDAVGALVADLTGIAPAAAVLAGAADALAELDRGVGRPPATYRAVADRLRKIAPAVELSRLFQVDVVGTAPGLALGGAVRDEMVRAVELLHRLTPSRPDDAVDRFRDAFAARYEDREVPLVEALDEEVGVGFGAPPGLATEGAPLLGGLRGVGRGGERGAEWTGAQRHQLHLLLAARRNGANEIVLTDADLDALANRRPDPLPDALAVKGTVVAASPDALGRGDFRVLVDSVVGPSGGRFLGRFCHAEAAVEALVRSHIAAEEAHRPDAAFAEVVHLPEGRVGNVLARPVLRQYEIPFLGRSGAPPERRLPVDDLLVSVEGARVVLRSRRLGCEVLPRLTNAHNFSASALAVYRFLGAVQGDGLAGGLFWDWGPLGSTAFLPRVRHGRVVLQRARWSVTGTDLEPLRAARTPADRVAAAGALHARLALPPWVAIQVRDNELPVDLRTVAGAELLAHEVRKTGGVRLVELPAAPGELVAESPAGRHTHEIVLPFTRPVLTGAARAASPAGRPRAAPGRAVEKVFPPGSSWLTAKLYTGRAEADAVLRDVVAPLVRRSVADGTCDGWFFLRYGDPDWHLRVRLHGDAAVVAAELVPRLHDLVRPVLASGRVARLVLDTYRREVDRYGGPEAIETAEAVFRADSDAALVVLGHLAGDDGLDGRWRVALCGVDRLLGDLGFDGDARHDVVRAWRDGLAAGQGATGDAARRWAGRVLREERADLAPLLDGERAARLAPALEALDARSAALAPLATRLRTLERAGRLTRPLADVAGSFSHMHVNRLLRGAQPAQELVIYELLDRLYRARAARSAAAR